MANGTLSAEGVKQRIEIEQLLRCYNVPLKRTKPDQFMAKCPFHEDQTPSLSVTPSKGLFHCFGCGASGDAISFVQRIEDLDFHAALKRTAEFAGISPLPSVETVRPNGTPMKPKANSHSVPAEPSRVVETYPYVDERGELLYEVLRLDPKSFRQRRPDGDGGWIWSLADVRRVLYRLPQVLTADTVYVGEGEKDVHTLEAAGVVATTNSGGAEQPWLAEYTEVLAAKTAVVIPDGDKPGRQRGGRIVKALTGRSVEVFLVSLPAGFKDVTEFFEAGNGIDDLNDLVDSLRREKRLAELLERGLLSPPEIIETVEGGLPALMNPPQGLLTGFRELDRLTHGLHAGELVIAAGRPSMGKTAWALDVVQHAAERGDTVAVFSYEMSRQSVLTRLLCSRARIDLLCFREGRLDRDERGRLSAALTDLSSLAIRIDDTPLPLQGIESRLRKLQTACGLGLVVIDYLQLIPTAGRENRNQQVGELSRVLKLMAGKLRVPFVVLSQLSRAAETRPNRRPQLSDLRDSGQIEQDADLVCLLYREEVYKPDQADVRGLAELIIAKQRNGPTGKIKLRFYKASTHFEDLGETHA